MKNDESRTELAEYKERLELTLNGTNCGTWHHDFKADIIHFDERAKKLLGIDKSSIDYENWSKCIHPDDVDRVSKTIEKKIGSKETNVTLVYRVIISNNIKYLKVNSIVKYQGELPKTSYGLIQDVTDMVNTENELKRLNKELQNALSEIKTIKGIIPICSCCHKIRDEKGAWNLMEEYISKHSYAEFSHSLCPKCYEEEMKNIV